MQFFKKNWISFVILSILLCLLLSTWWLINGDIYYDIDTSRDFLVLREVLQTGKLTLLGPRSGVVGGLFHGPLWYYINLPVFFLTNGDPILIGWFWWGLSILTLIIFWKVCEKLFNRKTAVLATLLYSANSIINPSIGLKRFFNPYGAVVLSPIFFYFFVIYIKKRKPIFLALSLFILGLIIQFQMAFGIPILFLTLLYLIFFSFKKGLFKHLLILPIIFIPLSTFIIFDIRHDFLQTQSLVRFLTSQTQMLDFNLRDFVLERITTIFTEAYFLLTQDNRILSWIYSLLFLFFIFNAKIPISVKQIYFMFLYFYFGFWALFFFFGGSWSTYYWPFLPLIIMLFTGFINFINRKIFLLFFIPALIWNMYIGLKYISEFNLNVERRGINSWAFNKLVADTVYKDAEGEFGYFIYTPNRWVYNQWYSLYFMQRSYPNKIAYPFSKKSLTYLIFVDVPAGTFDPISNGWKITDLKINKDPAKIIRIREFEIQKYNLSEDEINLEINPYLLRSTFFR